ncbi:MULTISPECIES: fumarylacetoacetate hydrolase family protein [Paraburkholderia]|uniref:fumarylacetoacetate hydrolase family protein n=1 Tax=Paraburkholderia TaxID=1822464 RepID=UPI002250E15D|nr:MULTISPECIES: fumarylacetoacetate hydrolase family protein [Paraburkholderia]MCX4163624.1 fumarylacetoacetate hydrolase family protein [Paraburkholderia megapolitana]MDN7159119.1 fumarylacetoacetate hydrolase family protein [Paraburkholderia sp. CHISQ3]MDQ6496166.1 fumarylacetoacetate hydrolase family protein [Paraburkholderia megapolitana]
MKLASLINGERDGRLIIVSRDLTRAVIARAAKTLLEALESWESVSDSLATQAQQLEDGMPANVFPFFRQMTLAPLPRAPQWLDASAFKCHSELVAKAWNNRNRWSDETPLMYQGASDDFLPCYGPSLLPSEEHDMDFEAEIVAVVDDVPMGVSAEQALNHVRLIGIANDVSLRAFGASEQDSGFGFVRAKPSTVFGPVFVTPDELAGNWSRGKLHGSITVHVNDHWVGSPHTEYMSFGFGELIAHAATSRRLSVGTIFGSGTVSDPLDDTGSATILEIRAIEKLKYGECRTAFLRFGDSIKINVVDNSGNSIFGVIEHQVLKA